MVLFSLLEASSKGSIAGGHYNELCVLLISLLPPAGSAAFY